MSGTCQQVSNHNSRCRFTESVDIAISMVIHDNSTADSCVGFASRVGLHPIEPGRISRDVNLGSQVDVLSAVIVQLGQVVQSQG